MSSSLSASATSAGILSAFVGFASSFAIVLHGLSGVGASAEQATSGLMALAIAMGICGIGFSLWKRVPISVAWSTPSAALLATSGLPEGGFAAAVGAFVFAGLLVVITGLWKPLGRIVGLIPVTLAQAMLAGVILPLCLVPFEAVAEIPALALPVVLAWFVAGQINKLLAVPAALLAFLVVLYFHADTSSLTSLKLVQAPVFVIPEFSLSALIGIGIPIYIVTMASQNIPGVSILRSFGYQPVPGPLFSWTGVGSVLSAPFGGHGISLAAITAAICANEDAHKDPAKRYWAAVIAGVVYIIFGIFSAGFVGVVELAPRILIGGVAGLALIGTLTVSVQSMLKDAPSREPAILTFLITASGLSFFGIGAAFWGLLVGMGLKFWMDWKQKGSPSEQVTDKA
ncbi:Inner membrane protein YdcO [Pseudovibrio sp. W64]|uniref:benzoate/H(+) symporter BenE family transporter n=1 Tax=unclassified Pseudovibrio TaxID=2627060 RepID=UPI0007AEBC3F|nr:MULTISPECIES: benzoate/H(+) symporter BenE family transporter [unclassified Pseudovibrio]KZK78262.1 Inner membrane protein YdcO [Pseudovibrio sp. W64]KZK92880.1 Inner membrane protein YdcO [Pseudovibrio sp. Ad5]KZL13174.1 Inner membrane protein YdcO [Pseudovibrio sp. Ad26]